MSTGDCLDCLSHREAVRDAVAYKEAACPDGRWKKGVVTPTNSDPSRHQTPKAKALIAQKAKARA